VIEAGGMRVGVVSITDNEPAFAAKEISPGTNYIPIYARETHKKLQVVRACCDRDGCGYLPWSQLSEEFGTTIKRSMWKSETCKTIDLGGNL
jgi:hypothetical protein